MPLSRDEILTHHTMRVEPVSVPEWGGEVLVKELTGRERDAFEATIVGKKRGEQINLENFRARFVAAVVVDDKGQAVFYPSDVELLGDLSAAALERVFSAGRRLSGMTDQDVDELTKN